MTSLKNRKTNHFIGIRTLSGNGSGHQLPPSATIPVTSATFKTGDSHPPTQPHILEEGLGITNQGLNQITQGLAINM